MTFHSWRNATIGSSRLALIAGNMPKTRPTAAEKPNDNATAHGGMAASASGESGIDRNSHRRRLADGQAHEPADEAQHDGLDEELHEDDARPRADGLAQADLAGPLADADEHDVHDADAADDERDADDAGGGEGDDAADRADLVDRRLDPLDVEGVGLARPDAAAVAEVERDLAGRVVDALGIDGRGGDVDERPRVGVHRLERVEGDVDLRLRRPAAEAGAAVFLHDADDAEPPAADEHVLARRVGRQLELVARLLVDQRDGRPALAVEQRERPAEDHLAALDVVPGGVDAGDLLREGLVAVAGRPCGGC